MLCCGYYCAGALNPFTIVCAFVPFGSSAKDTQLDNSLARASFLAVSLLFVLAITENDDIISLACNSVKLVGIPALFHTAA